MALLGRSQTNSDLVTVQCDYCRSPAVATNEIAELAVAGWALGFASGEADSCPWCIWLERRGRRPDRFADSKAITAPGRLPDLVIIGAAKAATTSLHHYLDQHPDIAMAPAKELRFFQGPRYLEWVDLYRSNFDLDSRLVGEATTTYSRSPAVPGVAERMAKLVPEARLILVVRDPVERAFASYVEERFHGLETRPLERAFADLDDPFNPYLAGSRYATQYLEYTRFYDPEALLVIDIADVSLDPVASMKETFGFLGVDPHVDIDVETRHNVRAEKRFYSSFGERLRSSDLGRRIRLLPTPVRRILTGPAHALLSSSGHLEIPIALRRAVGEALADDAAAFRSLTGRPFPHWSV